MLAHVVQQRAGRVRNPFNSGMAVVQDHALTLLIPKAGWLELWSAVSHLITTEASSGRVYCGGSTNGLLWHDEATAKLRAYNMIADGQTARPPRDRSSEYLF